MMKREHEALWNEARGFLSVTQGQAGEAEESIAAGIARLSGLPFESTFQTHLEAAKVLIRHTRLELDEAEQEATAKTDEGDEV